MTLNQAGIDFIKSWEGFSAEAYKCAAGVWTIGYGHTGKVNGKKISAGMKISKALAEALLRSDLAQFVAAVNNTAYVPFAKSLTQGQFNALVSFAFNCGNNNLKTLCKGRSAAEVAEKLLLYNKANGKTIQGLADRRKAERKMYLSDGKAAATSSAEKRICNMATLRRGDEGTQVGVLQTIVGADVDGVFGPKTEERVKKVQRSAGLKEDGIAGPLFWAAYLK